MEAGGSLMEHNRFFNKFGGDIQKIFSKCAKCKLKPAFWGQNQPFKKEKEDQANRFFTFLNGIMLENYL